MQEFILNRYFSSDPAGPEESGVAPEDLPGGPTYRFAARMASKTGAHVHASLYERAPVDDGLGYKTAIVVAPDGELVARTRKLHIPISAGYHEDRYFRPGPGEGPTPSRGRAREYEARPADVLGSVVSGGRSRRQPRGSRRAGLSDGDRV